MWTCCRSIDGVNYVEAVDDVGLSKRAGRIHRGGNSGYQALGLAYMLGPPDRVILLAYDMQPGPKGELHHHGRHVGGLSNPQPQQLREWARRFVQLGVDLRAEDVPVVNCSRRTALTCFEPSTLESELRDANARLLIPDDLLPSEHAAFKAGLAAAGYREGSDLSVVWGCRHRVGKNYDRLLVAENGYWSPPGEPYCALALNGHNGSGMWPKGSKERFERLGVAVRRWRAKGDHILVCPSRGIGFHPQPKDWTEKTVALLRELTGREIRVRPHPGNWKRLPVHPDLGLRAELENAWACVIWASTAGIRSLIQGIPVIAMAPNWICAGAAGNRLEDIESPPMPERLPVFYRMASAQWSLPEISSGKAFLALETVMAAQDSEQIAA